MAINLDKMNRAELLQLSKDVDAALKNADAKARQEALIAAEKAVAEYGYSLDEVTGSSGNAKKKAPAAPKYRNPSNPEQTWSGRGRKPSWLNEAIAAGVDITELEI